MTISTRHLLWLLAASFALHELEEWNIVAWEHAHFTPPPQFDELAARTLLVLSGFCSCRALVGIAAPQPLGAAAAGSSLSDSQLGLQRLGMRLSQWLWDAT